LGLGDRLSRDPAGWLELRDRLSRDPAGWLGLRDWRPPAVGTATDHELHYFGSIPGRGKRFVFTPQCLDHLWGLPGTFPLELKRP
jgi:hypothetical protein